MSETNFIYGFRKKLIDLQILIRLHSRAASHFGFFKSHKELRKYYKDSRCLFKTSSNRYLKVGTEIIGVPDMPPVNSRDFIDYVLQDIEWINNKKRPKLIFAIVCITSKCPFKCQYCYNSNLHTKEERNSTDTIIKTIEGLIKSGVKSIYLSGGEPMMRWDDLLMILQKFEKTDTRFWLLSTGYQLTEDKLAILQHAGLKGVMISLDTFNADQINSVKGSPNAFSYATNAIEAANKLGLVVAIDCVFGRTLLKKENFDKFIDMAGKYGAHFINCYSPRQMHHLLENEYNSFGLPEYNQLEVLTTENHNSSRYRSLPIAYSPDLWEAKRGCVGGKLFVYIDPAGDVKFCPFVEKSFGNINETDISEILKNRETQNASNSCLTNKLLSGL